MSNSIYNSRIEEITNGVHMILKNQSLVVGKAFESYKKKSLKQKDWKVETVTCKFYLVQVRAYKLALNKKVCSLF